MAEGSLDDFATAGKFASKPGGKLADKESPKLWYYFAPDSSWQGPYGLQQLILLRQSLPMDSWLYAAGPEFEYAAVQSASVHTDTQCETFGTDSGETTPKEGFTSAHEHGPSGHDDAEDNAAHWSLIAEVLGDEQLLAAWRSEKGITEATNSLAPPAAVFEERIRVEAQEAQQAYEPSEGNTDGLLQAVLAGLPEHDEARKLADLAAAGGSSLKDLVQFSHSASRARSPPIDYKEYEATDEISAEAAEGGDRIGGSRDWRKRKKQKKAAKLSRKNAWLYS